jgi:hypothetical protein
MLALRGHAPRPPRSVRLQLFQELSTLGQQVAHPVSLRQGLSSTAAQERDDVRGRKARFRTEVTKVTCIGSDTRQIIPV